MKKILLLLICGLVSTSQLSAQDYIDDTDLIKQLFNDEKKTIVEEFISLPAESADAFWEIYGEYMKAMEEISDNRTNNLQHYSRIYGNVNDENAAPLMKDVISNMKAYTSLKTKYYKKIQKAAGAKASLSFMILEEYIDAAITFSVLDVIPFIEN